MSTSASPASLQVGAAGPPPQSTPGERPALAAVLLGFFTIMVDAMIVNVALPSIGRGFDSGMTGLQWVVDGYTLAFAAFLLSAGAVSDRIGARQAFACGLGLFVAASAVCAMAPNLSVLVAARLVQGAGAALVVPSSLALLRETFPDPAARARAIALWGVGGSVGAAAGPVAGGLLTLVDWRMIFFVNLPVGALALALLRRAPRSPRQEVPFDWTGQVAAVAAMGALTYAVIGAGADGFGAGRVLVAFAVAVVAAVVYLFAQARGRHPMTPLPLLRSRTMSLSAAIGFALNVGFYGMIFLLGLYLQQVHGLSALGTGVAFLPMTVLTSFMGPVAARLATRFGARMPVITGQCLMAAGLLAMVALPAGTPVWLTVVLMVPVGAGGAMAVTALVSLLLEKVPAERAGVASGVLNAARQLGGALAVAVFGALVADRAGFVSGLHTSLLIAAATVAVSVVATVLLRAQVPHRIPAPAADASPSPRER
ncbi:MFS transporter [Streptomyces sp. NBC_00365]|uniref:MFS transporter n=1 Tax=Streptomyces sp. NBC_00365 TaxID=2975726 RepID=UPI00224D198B|nr:MFS transporter [Streptomyces sp. NBC_00365]MCX5095889.1 MFS transporter [Streptomyces sp. NBC_00365]